MLFFANGGCLFETVDLSQMGQDLGSGHPQSPLPISLSALQSELSEARRRLAVAERALAEPWAENMPPSRGTAIANSDVAKRQQAAESDENDQVYRAVFEQSAVAMARLSAVTGRFAEVNNAFCDLVGYSKKDMLKLTPSGITFADDREADALALAAMLRGEAETYEVEKRYLRKDGRLMWVHVRAKLIRDAQANPATTFAIVQDINDRKAAEASLRVSQDHVAQQFAEIEAIYETAPVGLGVFDRDLRYLRVNDRLAEINGVPAADHIGRTMFEVLPDIADFATEMADRVITHGESLSNIEISGETPAFPGVTRTWVAHWRPVRDRDRSVIGANVVVEEITEQKHAETALRNSEGFNRIVLESSPDCLKVLDSEGRIEYINNNGVCLLDLDDRAAVIGELWETLWPPSHHDRLRKGVAAALAGNATSWEAAAPTAKGIPKIWNITVAPVLEGEGQPSKVFVASHDVTELRRGEQELRESELRTHMATQIAGIGLWQWNVLTGEIRWDRTMFDLYGMRPTVDGSISYDDWISAVLADDVAGQEAILQNTVATCGSSEREFRVTRHDDQKARYMRAVETARPNAQGITEWVTGTNLDITEQKERQNHIDLLMGEVNHRSKNMLSVVMSVAHQTRGTDHAEFMQRFSARIQSLAAGQDLLVESQWKGVPLDDLVRGQLGHFKDLIGDRITLTGSRVLVSASAAQTIGMALHELATNASKYGALSTDQGRVAIAWQLVEGTTPAQRFVLTWTESDGPPVVAPKRRGFGSAVTGKMVKMSLDGEVTASFHELGFSWQLDCPFQNVRGEVPGDSHVDQEAAGELSHFDR